MVFVSVRNEDGTDPILVLHEICDVRDAEVNARHVLFGEKQPRVDDDDILIEFQSHHVLADFTQAAERDYS